MTMIEMTMIGKIALVLSVISVIAGTMKWLYTAIICDGDDDERALSAVPFYVGALSVVGLALLQNLTKEMSETNDMSEFAKSGQVVIIVANVVVIAAFVVIYISERRARLRYNKSNRVNLKKER